MVKQDDKLQALWHMKVQSEQSALVRLENLGEQLSVLQKTLRKLRRYQREYKAQFQNMKLSQMTVTVMHYFSNFLQQLEHAIGSNQMQLVLLKKELEQQYSMLVRRKKEAALILEVLQKNA